MDVRVVKQDEEVTFGVGGKIVEQIRVQFMVGDNGPFYFRFPKTDYNATAARAQLEAFADQVRALPR